MKAKEQKRKDCPNLYFKPTIFRIPYLNGSDVKYKFAGDTKSYSFHEFIQELDRRSKQ